MKNSVLWISTFVAVTVLYHVCYGLGTLIPTNISWLMTVMHDWGTHYLGWYFYRNEPWHFPIGSIYNYYYPPGTNVGFTDSIPLLAIFFKVFNRLLPEDFQYFGPWLYLCHLLAAFFSIKILQRFNVNSVLIFFAALLIAANPVLVYRGLHPALCAHWIFLASIYLYFSPSIPSAKVLMWQLILLIVAALVNPYICFMVLGFSFILPLKLSFLDRILKRTYVLVYLVVTIIALLVCWKLVGLIDINSKEELGVTGAYGLYSLNLNALYNPVGFSSIMPSYSQVSWHQYEGYMYLGLGIIVLFVIAICAALLKKIKGVANWLPRMKIDNVSLFPLFILVVLYTIFSVTHIISINDRVLLTLPVPKQVVSLGEIFRASARFFWAPYYLIILFTIVAIDRLPVGTVFKLGIVFFALVIQLYDTKRMLTFRKLSHGEYHPPINKSWSFLIKQFDAIVFYPPFLASYNSNLDYQYFSFLAAKERKPITVGYVARSDSKRTAEFLNSLRTTLANGRLDPKVLYITTLPQLKDFSLTLVTRDAKLNTLDNYYFLFSNSVDNPALWRFTDSLSNTTRKKLDSAISIYAKRNLFEVNDKKGIDATRKLLFQFDELKDEERFISFDAWALIEGARDNKQDTIFLTLENEHNFYVALANVKLRPDIASRFKLPLENSGINGMVFKDHVRPGEYDLGILIKDQQGTEVYQSTGTKIRVGIPDFTRAEKINVPPISTGIIYGIDQFAIDSAFVKLNGWAAFEKEDATNFQISIIFKNDSSTYAAPIVDQQLRPDVNARPGNTYNLLNSGFNAKVLKQSLPKGIYQLGILIKDKRGIKEAMVPIDKKVEIR